MGLILCTIFDFLHRKRVIHRKREKRGSLVNLPGLERFDLHSRYTYQSKRNNLLYKVAESFFFEFQFFFELLHFFPKKLVFHGNFQLSDVISFLIIRKLK